MLNVKMNADQIGTTIQALEWAKNDDYPPTDPTNAHIQRIIDKLVKLWEEETGLKYLY